MGNELLKVTPEEEKKAREYMGVPIVEDIREGLLESVVHRAKLAEMLEDAIESLHSKLKAIRTKTYTHRGEIISKEYEDDHEMQMKATEQIIKLCDALPKQKATKEKKVVNINMAPIYSPEMKSPKVINEH